MIFSFFSFVLSPYEWTNRKNISREEEEKKKRRDGRDHPLRDRVMDITDMLCNPPEFTVPSILIKKEREKANQSRVERERGGAIFSLPVCVCVWISADFHFYLAKNVCGCWPKEGEEEEEDFST